MVQQQQQQLQYNETGLGNVPNAEVRIRILVGEKGRLGCGVCRGIVPGLTVQVNNILIECNYVIWKQLAFLRFLLNYCKIYSAFIKIEILTRHPILPFQVQITDCTLLPL